MVYRKILGFIGLAFVLVFLWFQAVSAQSFRSNGNITIPADETVNSALWIAGNTITIAGDVNGDVFCAAQNVNISGDIEGDVLCATQNLTVSGNVVGDIRAAAQTISISADIAGNITIAAQNFSLGPASSIGRDASIAAQQASFQGAIGRDAAVNAEQATLAGTVRRHVTGNITQLEITSQADIGGRVDYVSPRDTVIAEGAQIAGEINRQEPERDRRAGADFARNFALYLLLSFLLIVLVLVLLLPGLFRQATEQAIERPWFTLLSGFVVSFIVPILIVVLLLTVIGIPLAFLLLVTWCLVLITSLALSAHYIGRLVFRDNRYYILSALVGALLLYIGFLIPVLNLFVLLAGLWFGIGMLTKVAADRWRASRQKPRKI